MAADSSFFKPGTNCWKFTDASQASVLIDAHNYFTAFMAAASQARHSILILAWDIDTRVRLDPGKKETQLGVFLARLLDEKPGLQVYILCWDFAMIYSLERELFPQFRKNFRHPRIHFVLDGRHPFGASQHQKVVVIDDQVAFSGGLDFTSHRWDTRQHRPWDWRRVDHAGNPYHPFHDVQFMVAGEAARALGELARDRWKRATGTRLPPPPPDLPPIWPSSVSPLFEKTRVAIARTDWSRAATAPIREVERFYLDSIRAAKRHVYIENQYFTADRVGEAILRRLNEPDPPEFFIVLPRFNSGWIEENTMGLLRLRLLEKLHEADRHGKLRVFYPVFHSSRIIPISVHSKIMVVDDDILHVGSSNLNNRSMGLDTECDLGLAGESLRERIALVRDSLLAEHMDAPLDSVRELVRSTGSLIRTWELLHRKELGSHALLPFHLKLHPVVNWMTPDNTILDPAHPIEEDPFFSRFIPHDRSEFLELKYRKLVNRLMISVMLALLLWLPEVRDWVHPSQVLDLIQAVPERFNELALGLAYFFIGSLLLIPADVLIFLACLVFGTREAWFYSLAGLCVSGLIYYGAGMFRSHKADHLDQAVDPNDPASLRNQKISAWVIFLLNANLTESFRLIAFQSGKLRVRIRPFLSGTAGGQAFRILAITLYVALLESFIRSPGFIGLGSVLTCAFVILWTFRWFSRRFLPSYTEEPRLRTE